jgi:uncharacterized membrane protein YfhO
VLSEAYFPERRAWIDGREVPIQRTDLAFSGLYVPAGSHRVEVRYVPASFYLGATVSVLTLLAWIGLWGWSRRRGRAESALPR